MPGVRELLTAGAAALTGSPGILIGPTLATLAKWAVTGKPAEALGDAVASVFSDLAAESAEDAIERISAGSSGDLERILALAIRDALRIAYKNLKAWPEWFVAWDARLSDALKSPEATESLFHSETPANPVYLAQAPAAEWWEKFEPVLVRWAGEWSAPPPVLVLPPLLRDHLTANLQPYTHAAVLHLLRGEANQRAWVAYQQRFLERIAAQLPADSGKEIRAIDVKLDDLKSDIAKLSEQVERLAHPLIPIATVARRTPTGRMRSDLDLLDPYRRTVRYQGRESQLDSMLQWVASARQPISIRVVVGRAGSGKTRFAIELLNLLEERHPGWFSAGFLPKPELDQGAPRTWRWDRPTLVVLDYASAVLTPLRAWFDALSRLEEQEHPLRILLLDRQAGSLESLRNPSWGHADLFDDTKPDPLEEIEDIEQRREQLKAMLHAAATRRGVPMPVPPPPGTNGEFERRLALPLFADPLCVQMAALASFAGDGPPRVVEAMAMNRTGLAFALAEMERARLRRFAGDGVSPEFLTHLAVCVTLTGGLEEAEVDEAAAREAKAFGSGASLESCREAVKRAMGGGGGLLPVKPDIIGEAVVMLGTQNEAGSGANSESSQIR
ncbi:MAG: hypothetical protein FJW39_28695 [Acidobacteria bacterium]|nr:hypothetical protein [Acidobacteriota bacterium]